MGRNEGNEASVGEGVEGSAEAGGDGAAASVWSRLNRSLAKTRRQVASGLGGLLRVQRIDESTLETLQEGLLTADVGVEATERVLQALKRESAGRGRAAAPTLHAALTRQLVALLEPVAQPFVVGPARPHVVLVVGVNGAGKTTLIGKLTASLRAQGHSVLLAAGDTFRAAAVAQLAEWGARNDVPVVSQGQGADSASVIFDAMSAARARGVDVVLADTAGRLQAKTGLMDELRKIKRVMGRQDAAAPHEVLLVLDAGIGQNALSQVREFHKAVDVTSLAVTKLDGTAKGGVLVAIAAKFQLPVRFVGVGEGIADLQPFEAASFVRALLPAAEV